MNLFARLSAFLSAGRPAPEPGPANGGGEGARNLQTGAPGLEVLAESYKGECAKPSSDALGGRKLPSIGHLDLAVPLIQHFESCRLAPYLDSANVPTVGWGSTRWKDGRAVKLTDAPITQKQADDLFAYYLADFDHNVGKIAPPWADAGCRAALLSFAYNCGVTALDNSTAMTRLRKGDVTGASEALTWWNKAGGKVLKGLQRRRKAESLVMLGQPVKAAILAAEKAYP